VGLFWRNKTGRLPLSLFGNEPILIWIMGMNGLRGCGMRGFAEPLPGGLPQAINFIRHFIQKGAMQLWEQRQFHTVE
jgi:hypothetical protein